MVCIYCRSETSVTNSRLQKRLNNVWRRRTCQQCGSTFTTIEKPELLQSLMVRGSKGKLAPFSRDVLFVSVYASLGHRTDPISDATALTSTITAKVLNSAQSGVIEATSIMNSANVALARFDKVAGIHYAAYHPAKL